MPITVQVKGGTEVEFPDDTSPDTIKSVLDRNFGQKPPPTNAPTAAAPASAPDASPDVDERGQAPAKPSDYTGPTFDVSKTATPSDIPPTDFSGTPKAGPGGLETAAEHAAVGVGPGAAFVAGAEAGGEAGAFLGGPLGAFFGALLTGGFTSWRAYKLQHNLLQAAAPQFTAEMDKRLQQGSEAHPFMAVAGDVAGNLPSMEMELPKLAQLPFRAALGGTVGGVMPLARGEKPTKRDVVEGVIQGTVFGRGRFGEGGNNPPPTPLEAKAAEIAQTAPLTAEALVEKPQTPEERAKLLGVPPEGQPTIPAAEVQRMAAAQPKEPNASEVSQTAALHGDVQPQPESGARQVPPSESGGGIQSQAERGIPQEEPAQPHSGTPESVAPAPEANPVTPVEAAAKPPTVTAQAKEFKQLVQEYGQIHGWVDTPDFLHEPETAKSGMGSGAIQYKIARSKETQRWYRRALHQFGEESKYPTPADMAKALPKLKAFLAEQEANSKLVETPILDMPEGSTFTVAGKEHTVGPIDPETLEVTINGPTPSKVHVEGSVKIDPGSLKATPKGEDFLPEEQPSNAAPKLAPGVKQGDLIASTQREDFALTGEKGTDADRIAAAKAKAAKDAAEAKAVADKQQLELKPAAPEAPKTEGGKPQAYRIRNFGPQLFDVVRELPATEAEKANNDPVVVEVKNRKTGETQPILKNQLEAVKERTAEQKAKAPKQDLDQELRDAGMDPSVFSNVKQKRDALFRAKAKAMESGKGDLQMAFIPGMREFIEQDVIPGIKKAAQGVAESADELNSALRAPNKSDIAGQAAGIVRHHTAELAKKDIRARDELLAAEKMFNKAGVAFNLDFIDRMEEGKTQRTGSLDAISKQLRHAFDTRVAAVRALGTGKLEKLIENYFPHLWEQPSPARGIYSIIFGKRPLEGSRAFLKRRTIPTTKDGILAGLKPVSTNPVELTLLKLHEIDRYVMAHKILNEFKENGLAKFVRATEFAPEGYTAIDDRIAQVYEGTTAQGSLAKRGAYYAPDDAARILNNYLAPGLRKFALFRGAMALSNAMNQAQLGLSLYHARFTTIDSANAKLSLALEKVSRGDFKGAARDAALAVTAPTGAPAMENLARGSKVLKEYTKPGTAGGNYAAIVDALVKGGGRVTMDKFYKNSSVESFWKAFHAGNYPGALLRAPFAGLEAASKPVMEVMVPRMKLGIFADMAQMEMDRNPNMTLEEQRRVFGKIWDSVDNRMGQMVYDNLFWHKAAKDLAMLGTRSLGWNLGTIRELGGGVKDTATLVSRLKRGDPAVTHRMAYAAALPVMVGFLGAVYHYMHTGKAPEELQDYFMPKTGKTLPDGSPERVMLPTYMKDISPLVKAGHDFGAAGVISRAEQMAVNKTGPGLNMITRMMQNRDFYGTEIIHKNDPLMAIAGDEFKFVVSQFKPFTVSQFNRRVEPGKQTAYETFTGIMPATKELTRTKSMQIISEYNSRFGGARTKSEADLLNQRHEIAIGLKNGDPKADEALQELVDKGRMTGLQAKALRKSAASEDDPRLTAFKRLPIDVAEEAFAAGTPEEQELWKDQMEKKRSKYGR